MSEARNEAEKNGLPLAGFPPAGAVGATARPRFLVLGSFPSVLSLERHEYYGNPRNHFWAIVAACFGSPEPRSYPQKIALLTESGIALWDVYSSCERAGSLDKDIECAKPNPLAEFLLHHPSVEAVGANGGMAAAGLATELGFPTECRLGRTGDNLLWKPVFAPSRAIRVFRLPSTSPVPTAHYKSASDKLTLWKNFFTIRM